MHGEVSQWTSKIIARIQRKLVYSSLGADQHAPEAGG